jgi:hypothetical protein
MGAVTHEIEEPGLEPFWSLRIFSTMETAEELIKVNIDKYEKIDAFLAECRVNEGRVAFKEEMEKLLKRNPTLLTAAQPATNITGPLANVGKGKEKVEPKPAEDKPQFNFPPQGGIGPTDTELGRDTATAAAPSLESFKEPG